MHPMNVAERTDSAASVTFNVGGRQFQTSPNTLAKIPKIHKLLNAGSNVATSDIFIDRDPEIFETLLRAARGYPIDVLLQMSCPAMRSLVVEDAKYFGMGLFPQSGNFAFKLKPSACVTLSNDRTGCTVGKIAKDVTVMGDQPLPATGRVYWEVALVKLTANNMSEHIGVVEPSVKVDGYMGQKGAWSYMFNRSSTYVRNDDNELHKDLLPKLSEGSVVGVDVDMDRGSLSFWKDGEFLATTVTGLKGKTLYPAVGITDVTVMEIRSGLACPDPIPPRR